MGEVDQCALRYSRGVWPMTSWKAAVNLLGLSYPTMAPISETFKSRRVMSSFAA